MSGYKVRLSDGSEIGPMDLAALKTWQLQGLIDGDSPVMRSGSRKWVPLRSLPEFKGARRTRTSSRSAKSAPRQGRTAPESLLAYAESWLKLRSTSSISARRVVLAPVALLTMNSR